MRILLSTVALLLALPGAAYAEDVLINNGLDCSNPGNVIDDYTYASDSVHVRNVVGRFEDRSHQDVRLDSGTLDLPRVFRTLARLDFQGWIIPEHFPTFPCQEGSLAGRAFSVGYCRGLIQASRHGSRDGQACCR